MAEADDILLRDEPRLRDTCRWLGFDDDLSASVIAASRALFASPDLTRLLSQLHHRLFVARCDLSEVATWRMLPPDVGEARDLFYALVLLSGIDDIRALHRSRQIPEAISRDTLADVGIWIREHRKLHGRYGLEEIWWPANYFTGRVYAIGRLQFEVGRFYLPFHVFRRRDARGTVAMPAAGQRFRDDGQFANADDGEDSRAWTSALSLTTDHVVGHPISPRGSVERQTVTLSLSEWSHVLRPDDQILIVHIPATGPLDPRACDESFSRAVHEFFPRHFSEHAVHAIATSSWMLDVQLSDYLPETSNLVRFQRRFHLLPQPGANDAQTKQRVFGFGKLPETLDKLPQQTSLQRIVVRHMRDGRRWRMSAGFILPDEISR
jgi:hypothetical protein